ncbi:hypothetical protein M3152_14385 [Sporosarcina luteola]|uniref:hypothetical protein n=1 Tax=Sporosarcina luteola TaxID=582850 RepID=UPI00203C5EE6|nr:hypothetical protein [Sporosarcina luteola]MCM3638887.1 hypothetical protein [Sporosarcina luteola]
MKKFVTQHFSSFIISILAGLSLLYFQQQSPEVKYTLSENIPIIGDIAGLEKDTNIQLLEVKNTGNKEANNIQVILNGEIENVSVEKNSSGDDFQIYKSHDNVELVYTSLPVTGTFKMVIQTNIQPIKDSTLIIKHNEGQGLNALENHKISFSLIIAWIIIVIYLLSTFKDLYIRGLYRKSYYYKQLDILHKVKPWYISNGHWKEIRNTAIDTLFTNDIDHNTIEEVAGYKLLSDDKHSNITMNEWEKIIKFSEEQIKRWVDKYINRSFRKSSEISVLLRTIKPKYYSEINWLELINIVERELVEKLKREIGSNSLDQLMNIDFSVLNIMKRESKEDFTYYYLQLLVNKIESAINESEKPFDIYIKYCDSNDIIPQYLLNHLERVAKNKQLIITPNLYEKENAQRFIEEASERNYGAYYFSVLTKIARLTVELDNKILKYNYLNKTLQQIIYSYNEPIIKPDFVDFDEFEKLMKLDTEIAEYKSKRKEVEDAKEEVIPLKRKIEKQLSIIDIVLNNPKEIEKIEDYSSEFSPGNFKNLKELAVKISEDK